VQQIGWSRVVGWLGGPVVVRRLALGLLVANVGIVITGGAVRLTGSGLGCPTWPRCTPGSYVPAPALGGHGLIEFGNRTLTGVLVLLALLAFASAISQRPRRRRTTVLAGLTLAGIPAQAVLGGLTVLTRLNPWLVGGHFLLSMAVIAAAAGFCTETLGPRPGPRPSSPSQPIRPGRPIRSLASVLLGVTAAVLAVGTVVTGSGPHAGDATAARTGLNPGTVAQLHADLVCLLIGLSVAAWFGLRAAGAPTDLIRGVTWLITAELAQGAVGVVQVLTHVPALLVGLHLAGACAVWLAALWLWFATRGWPESRPEGEAAGQPAGSRATIAAANRSAAPPAVPGNSDGSVSSSSISTGSPVDPGIRSTRA
jgi:heme a synthase